MKPTYFTPTLLFLRCLVFFLLKMQKQKKLNTQLSPFLSKTYFNFNLGGIYYPYSNDNLNSGYTSSDTKMNPFSGRFLLGISLTINWHYNLV